jgi:hypothetical protein
MVKHFDMRLPKKREIYSNKGHYDLFLQVEDVYIGDKYKVIFKEKVNLKFHKIN